MTGIIAAAGITAAAGLAGGLLSRSGGSSGGTQTQTSQTQMPDWVNNAAMQNYGDATKASYGLMPPYPGQRVADMPAGMTQDINALQNNVGSTTPWFNQALNQTNALSGFNPSMITPQTVAGTNLSPYENPYTQSVIDPSMQLLAQQNQQGLNSIGNNAIGSKAFGGSRQGVAEGAQNAQSNLLAGQLGAQLYGQNFNQAQAAATGDITRNMQAQTSNQQAGEWGAQFQGQMASQLGALAGSQQQNYLGGLQAAMGGQTALQAQQQNQLAAAQQYYTEQQQYPLQQLAIRQNALAQSPYGQTAIQQSPGPTTSPLLSGLGTAATVAGLYGTLGLNGLWNQTTPTGAQAAANSAATQRLPTGVGQTSGYGSSW
jgi:hypothetical protein